MMDAGCRREPQITHNLRQCPVCESHACLFVLWGGLRFRVRKTRVRLLRSDILETYYILIGQQTSLSCSKSSCKLLYSNIARYFYTKYAKRIKVS